MTSNRPHFSRAKDAREMGTRRGFPRARMEDTPMNLHRKFLIYGLALLGIFGSRVLACAGTCDNIAVPAYFYPSPPTSQWNTAVDNAPLPTGRSQILIMNPNSGPGKLLNQDYVKAVGTVHAAGAGFLVFGYVHTSYGKRSLRTVEGDIDKYYSWYAVDGIFVDETASSVSLVSSYYQPLADYITSKKAEAGVMLNPGVYPAQAYANIRVPPESTFIINVFEDSYANYWTATVPSWAFSYPRSLFSHLVYSATAGQMRHAVALSAQRNVGWIYVTDIGLPNPWKALPSYWNSLTWRVKTGC